MKKILLLLLSVSFLLISFLGCNNSVELSITDTTSNTSNGETAGANPDSKSDFEYEELINANFSSSPFGNVEEGSRLNDGEVKAIMSQVPFDKYEAYPALHNIPLTATLYKNGEASFIDIRDARLISLINLYNNSVYYHQYSYTQGLLSIDYLETNVLNEEFRLVLTFSPNSNDTDYYYDTNIQAYDTLVITNKWFVLIGYDLLGYEGQEDNYPFQSVGHSPLFNDYCWLDLFGF